MALKEDLKPGIIYGGPHIITMKYIAVLKIVGMFPIWSTHHCAVEMFELTI